MDYITGLPCRIGLLEELLAWLASRPGAWVACGDQILDARAKQQ